MSESPDTCRSIGIRPFNQRTATADARILPRTSQRRRVSSYIGQAGRSTQPFYCPESRLSAQLVARAVIWVDCKVKGWILGQRHTRSSTRSRRPLTRWMHLVIAPRSTDSLPAMLRNPGNATPLAASLDSFTLVTAVYKSSRDSTGESCSGRTRSTWRNSEPWLR